MKSKRKILIAIVIILSIGFLIPQNFKIPVQGATSADYNSESFWYYPWGKSITHKGVDIFAKKGVEINSSTSGIVLYVGEIDLGGKVVLILGPKWRLHYYAHLNEVKTSSFSIVNSKTIIGAVGSSGNAVGKPPHLHYSILTIFPYIWKLDSDRQGWKKMFYLNPIDYLNKN